MKTLCTILSLLFFTSAEAQFSNISLADLQSAIQGLNIPQNGFSGPETSMEDQMQLIELIDADFWQEIHCTEAQLRVSYIDAQLNGPFIDAQSRVSIGSAQIESLSKEALIDYILNFAPFEDPVQNEESGVENARLVAALLALSLGPFGVHRMYLGTELRVPVFYTLTLGGGLGILPLIDFFYIIFSKEDVLKENGKIFMWGAGT